MFISKPTVVVFTVCVCFFPTDLLKSVQHKSALHNPDVLLIMSFRATRSPPKNFPFWIFAKRENALK